MRRVVLLLVLLALACPAAAAAQSDGGGAFGPLPPASTPEPAPAPIQDSGEPGDVGRSMLYLIGGGLGLLFVVIGFVITRDARRNLPRGARAAAPRLRDEGPHRHARRAKAKARAKGRAQKASRRKNR